LNWLRAFEAAARHLSFTRAGEELRVTQAAVSQQVSKLEQHLGFPLFRRVKRRLFLTDAGQDYACKLRGIFQSLARATADLRAREAPAGLTLRLPSSFANKWLVPRLHRFHARFPEIDLRLTAMGREVDFARDDIDLEIRHGDGHWPELQVEHLVGEEVFPVCSPDLPAEEPGLEKPADLLNHELLHVPGYPEDWAAWFAAAGLDYPQQPRGVRFDQSIMALQAAAQGAGVALGRTPLVEEDLALKRLVAPFDLRLPAQGAYWIVYPRQPAPSVNLRSLRDWLLEEAHT
jgi:LysR family glycine cleavage system transcriptional activator